MKFVFFTLVLFTLGTAQASTEIFYNILTEQVPPVAEKDMIMSTDAHSVQDEVHFDLIVLNESENVVYGLKREYVDGRFETAMYSKATSNPEDPFVTHNLKDSNVPEEDFTYVLMRIHQDTREFKVVGRWNYCHAEGEICADVMFASN
jgi:hypothetical protein